MDLISSANDEKSAALSPQVPRLRKEILLLFPALVSLLIYLPTLNHGVIADDRSLIVENPFLVGLSGLRELWTDDLWEASAVHLPAQYYRPLAMTSFWIQVLLLGQKVWWLRFGNVLIHAITATLLPRLLLRTNPKLSIPLATLASLCWALHPLNSESVIWLSGRFDALVVLFAVLALLVNTYARRMIWFPIVLALALLTKEIGIAIFPAVILFDIVQHGGLRSSFKLERTKWLAALVVVGFYLVLRRVLGIYGASDVLLGIAPSVFLSGFADLAITYTRLTFVPLDLDVFHWSTTRSLLVSIAVFSASIGIWVASFIYSWKHKNGAIAAGCTMALLSLMLASNVGPSQHIFGDRFWSFTGIALALTLGEGFERHAPIARLRLLPWAAASFVLALLTLLRGTEWASEERMADIVLEREPKHPHWLLLSSHHLLRRGDTFEARKILERLIKLEPQMAKAHNALCVVEMRNGRLEQAERECREATRLNPDNAATWVNLGSVYVNAKKYDETRDVAEKALSIQPKNAEAEYLLAVVFANRGRMDLVQQHLAQGLAISPNHAGLRQLKAQIAERTPTP